MWSASFVQGHVLVECKVVKYVKCSIPISNKFLVDLSKVEVFEEQDQVINADSAIIFLINH